MSAETTYPSGAGERRRPLARAQATLREAARPRPQGLVRRVARLVADVARKGDRDRVLGLAAENAFMAVLTLFPTLLVAAAFLGQLALVIGRERAVLVEREVLEFLDELLTDSAAPAVETARQLFASGSDALTLALALALVSLATAFAGIVNTVTITYDVQDSRGWWHRRFLGLLIGLGSVVTGALAVTLIVIGPLFGRAVDVIQQVGLQEDYAVLWSYARPVVAFLTLVAWASFLLHVCPDRQGRWRLRNAVPGGLLTAVFWLVASVGFSEYLRVAVSANPVFGALGGGLILMTWFYLLCLGLLLGGELNAVLLARAEVRRRQAQAAEKAPAA
ncbi:MAG: YihY/virulence factor BrkB family protein [Actinomycetota bacterium]|nr:YihY/virulence factor BrkB family protein [Actinomycetota bacterium]